MKNTLKKFIYIALLTVFFIVALVPNCTFAVGTNDEEK